MRIGRLIKWTALVLVLAAFGYLGFVFFNPQRDPDPSDYPATVQELDQTDPGWRLAPLVPQAARDPAANLIADISSRLDPALEPPPNLFTAAIPPPPSEYAPPVELLADARRLGDARDEPTAPQLEARDWLPGPPPEAVRAARRVARLLFWGGIQSVRRGEYADTVRSAAALARVRRVLSLDPRESALRTRLECLELIVTLITVTLAEGPIPDPILVQMAALLWEEPADAAVEFARYDRALCHACLEEARYGRLRHPDLPPPLWEERWHARALRALTRSAEFARTHAGEPFDVVRANLPQLANAFRAEAGGVERFGPDGRAWANLQARHVGLLEEVFEGVATTNARVRCARTALGAERYRVRHGTWPTGPAGLVPAFLAAWPTDPRNGRELRLARWEGGLNVLGDEPPAPPPPPAGNGPPLMATGNAMNVSLLDPANRRQAALKRPPDPPR
jgi:hypothetical protein